MASLKFEDLKKNMDDWVKDMSSKVSGLEDVPQLMVENTDNIQHNYELIIEMKKEIDDLKDEIKILKLMGLAVLKERKLKH